MTTITHKYHVSKIIRSLALFASVSLLAAVPALAQSQGQAQGQGQDQDLVQQKLQELQNKMQTLNAEIYEVQSEANRAPEVQQALLNYNKVLTEEMKKIDPENKSLIDERQEIYEQLLRLNTGEMTPEKESQLEEIGQKFNSIRQQLAQTEAQANQTAEASAAMEGYNQVVMSEMTEIEPGIEEKIERREALGREFTDLRNAVMQQQAE